MPGKCPSPVYRRFGEYTMSGGTVGPVDEAQLDALVERYEWFTPARILRVLQTGRSDRRVSDVYKRQPPACRKWNPLSLSPP